MASGSSSRTARGGEQEEEKDFVHGARDCARTFRRAWRSSGARVVGAGAGACLRRRSGRGARVGGMLAGLVLLLLHGALASPDETNYEASGSLASSLDQAALSTSSLRPSGLLMTDEDSISVIHSDPTSRQRDMREKSLSARTAVKPQITLHSGSTLERPVKGTVQPDHSPAEGSIQRAEPSFMIPSSAVVHIRNQSSTSGLMFSTHTITSFVQSQPASRTVPPAATDIMSSSLATPPLSASPTLPSSLSSTVSPVLSSLLLPSLSLPSLSSSDSASLWPLLKKTKPARNHPYISSSVLISSSPAIGSYTLYSDKPLSLKNTSNTSVVYDTYMQFNKPFVQSPVSKAPSELEPNPSLSPVTHLSEQPSQVPTSLSRNPGGLFVWRTTRTMYDHGKLYSYIPSVSTAPQDASSESQMQLRGSKNSMFTNVYEESATQSSKAQEQLIHTKADSSAALSLNEREIVPVQTASAFTEYMPSASLQETNTNRTLKTHGTEKIAKGFWDVPPINIPSTPLMTHRIDTVSSETTTRAVTLSKPLISAIFSSSTAKEVADSLSSTTTSILLDRKSITSQNGIISNFVTTSGPERHIHETYSPVNLRISENPFSNNFTYQEELFSAIDSTSLQTPMETRSSFMLKFLGSAFSKRSSDMSFSPTTSLPLNNMMQTSKADVEKSDYFTSSDRRVSTTPGIFTKNALFIAAQTRVRKHTFADETTSIVSSEQTSTPGTGAQGLNLTPVRPNGNSAGKERSMYSGFYTTLALKSRSEASKSNPAGTGGPSHIKHPLQQVLLIKNGQSFSSTNNTTLSLHMLLNTTSSNGSVSLNTRGIQVLPARFPASGINLLSERTASVSAPTMSILAVHTSGAQTDLLPGIIELSPASSPSASLSAELSPTSSPLALSPASSPLASSPSELFPSSLPASSLIELSTTPSPPELSAVSSPSELSSPSLSELPSPSEVSSSAYSPSKLSPASSLSELSPVSLSRELSTASLVSELSPTASPSELSPTLSPLPLSVASPSDSSTASSSSDYSTTLPPSELSSSLSPTSSTSELSTGTSASPPALPPSNLSPASSPEEILPESAFSELSPSSSSSELLPTELSHTSSHLELSPISTLELSPSEIPSSELLSASSPNTTSVLTAFTSYYDSVLPKQLTPARMMSSESSPSASSPSELSPVSSPPEISPASSSELLLTELSATSSAAALSPAALSPASLPSELSSSSLPSTSSPSEESTLELLSSPSSSPELSQASLQTELSLGSSPSSLSSPSSISELSPSERLPASSPSSSVASQSDSSTASSPSDLSTTSLQTELSLGSSPSEVSSPPSKLSPASPTSELSPSSSSELSPVSLSTELSTASLVSELSPTAPPSELSPASPSELSPALSPSSLSSPSSTSELSQASLQTELSPGSSPSSISELSPSERPPASSPSSPVSSPSELSPASSPSPLSAPSSPSPLSVPSSSSDLSPSASSPSEIPPPSSPPSLSVASPSELSPVSSLSLLSVASSPSDISTASSLSELSPASPSELSPASSSSELSPSASSPSEIPPASSLSSLSVASPSELSLVSSPSLLSVASSPPSELSTGTSPSESSPALPPTNLSPASSQSEESTLELSSSTSLPPELSPPSLPTEFSPGSSPSISSSSLELSPSLPKELSPGISPSDLSPELSPTASPSELSPSPSELSPTSSASESSPVSFPSEISPISSPSELSTGTSPSESFPTLPPANLSPASSPPELSPESAFSELSPASSPSELSPATSSSELSPTELSHTSSQSELSHTLSQSELSPALSQSELSPALSLSALSPISPLELSPLEISSSETLSSTLPPANLSPASSPPELSPESAFSELSPASSPSELSPATSSELSPTELSHTSSQSELSPTLSLSASSPISPLEISSSETLSSSPSTSSVLTAFTSYYDSVLKKQLTPLVSISPSRMISSSSSSPSELSPVSLPPEVSPSSSQLELSPSEISSIVLSPASSELLPAALSPASSPSELSPSPLPSASSPSELSTLELSPPELSPTSLPSELSPGSSPSDLSPELSPTASPSELSPSPLEIPSEVSSISSPSELSPSSPPSELSPSSPPSELSPSPSPSDLSPISPSELSPSPLEIPSDVSSISSPSELSPSLPPSELSPSPSPSDLSPISPSELSPSPLEIPSDVSPISSPSELSPSPPPSDLSPISPSELSPSPLEIPSDVSSISSPSELSPSPPPSELSPSPSPSDLSQTSPSELSPSQLLPSHYTSVLTKQLISLMSVSTSKMILTSSSSLSPSASSPLTSPATSSYYDFLLTKQFISLSPSKMSSLSSTLSPLALSPSPSAASYYGSALTTYSTLSPLPSVITSESPSLSSSFSLKSSLMSSTSSEPLSYYDISKQQPFISVSPSKLFSSPSKPSLQSSQISALIPSHLSQEVSEPHLVVTEKSTLDQWMSGLPSSVLTSRETRLHAKGNDSGLPPFQMISPILPNKNVNVSVHSEPLTQQLPTSNFSQLTTTTASTTSTTTTQPTSTTQLTSTTGTTTTTTTAKPPGTIAPTVSPKWPTTTQHVRTSPPRTTTTTTQSSPLSCNITDRMWVRTVLSIHIRRNRMDNILKQNLPKGLTLALAKALNDSGVRAQIESLSTAHNVTVGYYVTRGDMVYTTSVVVEALSSYGMDRLMADIRQFVPMVQAVPIPAAPWRPTPAISLMLKTVLRFVGPGDDLRSCRFAQLMEERLENAFAEAEAKVLLNPYSTLSVQILSVSQSAGSPAVSLIYVVRNRTETLNGTVASNLLSRLTAELVGYFLYYPPLITAEPLEYHNLNTSAATKDFWVITVIQDVENSSLEGQYQSFASLMEQRLAELFVVAHQQGARFKRATTVGSYTVQMVGMRRVVGPKNPAELTYYVQLNGTPLPGTTAAKILNTVDSQTMALTLGYFVQLQAEAVVKGPSNNLWIIASVLAPIGIVTIIIIIITAVLCHKNKSDFKTDGIGNLNPRVKTTYRRDMSYYHQPVQGFDYAKQHLGQLGADEDSAPLPQAPLPIRDASLSMEKAIHPDGTNSKKTLSGEIRKSRLPSEDGSAVSVESARPVSVRGSTVKKITTQQSFVKEESKKRTDPYDTSSGSLQLISVKPIAAPPAYSQPASSDRSQDSAVLNGEVNLALKQKSDIEHYRNKLRLKAKRKGYYDFPSAEGNASSKATRHGSEKAEHVPATRPSSRTPEYDDDRSSTYVKSRRRLSEVKYPEYRSRQSLNSPSPGGTEMDLLVMRERPRKGIRNSGYDTEPEIIEETNVDGLAARRHYGYGRQAKGHSETSTLSSQPSIDEVRQQMHLLLEEAFSLASAGHTSSSRRHHYHQQHQAISPYSPGPSIPYSEGPTSAPDTMSHAQGGLQWVPAYGHDLYQCSLSKPTFRFTQLPEMVTDSPPPPVPPRTGPVPRSSLRRSSSDLGPKAHSSESSVPDVPSQQDGNTYVPMSRGSLPPVTTEPVLNHSGNPMTAVYAIPASRPGYPGYFISTPPSSYHSPSWMSYPPEPEVVSSPWTDSVPLPGYAEAFPNPRYPRGSPFQWNPSQAVSPPQGEPDQPFSLSAEPVDVITPITLSTSALVQAIRDEVAKLAKKQADMFEFQV